MILYVCLKNGENWVFIQSENVVLKKDIKIKQTNGGLLQETPERNSGGNPMTNVSWFSHSIITRSHRSRSPSRDWVFIVTGFDISEPPAPLSLEIFSLTLLIGKQKAVSQHLIYYHDPFHSRHFSFCFYPHYNH